MCTQEYNLYTREAFWKWKLLQLWLHSFIVMCVFANCSACTQIAWYCVLEFAFVNTQSYIHYTHLWSLTFACRPCFMHLRPFWVHFLSILRGSEWLIQWVSFCCWYSSYVTMATMLNCSRIYIFEVPRKRF